MGKLEFSYHFCNKMYHENQICKKVKPEGKINKDFHSCAPIPFLANYREQNYNFFMRKSKSKPSPYITF